MMPRRWFEVHAVNRRTENVCRDLMADIEYETGLTPYLHNQAGDLSLRVDDGAGGVFVLSDGEGGLPDGYQLALNHDSATQTSTLMLREWGTDGSILVRASSSLRVSQAVNLVVYPLGRMSA